MVGLSVGMVAFDETIHIFGLVVGDASSES